MTESVQPRPYRIAAPKAPCGALVYSSPHSGRYYPPRFKRVSRLDERMLRRSEDSFVDELFAGAPAYGAPLIAAVYPRAYVDLNREPYELDPLLFDEPLPAFANIDSDRVAAGLGTVARVVATGVPIYARPLPLAEAEARIAGIYRPYHEALGRLLAQARRQRGWSVLVDCHSMPSLAASQRREARARDVAAGWNADIVLGDRHGTSCDQRLTDLAEEVLTGMGYLVLRNLPYAGGYCTSHYGNPAVGRHALQIEINRSLYMDEARLAKQPHFDGLARDMQRLMAALARLDLSRGERLAAE